MNGLRAELARVGIRGRLASRIESELDDHLACDPDANLGAPSLIAQRFADELRVPKTLRATYLGFGGLALAAVVVAMSKAGPFAGVLVALAGQVAFAAGVLALWGARRGTAAAVVQRRILVALVGGVVVLVAVAGWVALVPAVVMAASFAELRAAVAITPRRVASSRGFSGRESSVLGLSIAAFVFFASAHAERSWLEGAERGVFEAVAFAAGYFALGRRLGIRRP